MFILGLLYFCKVHFALFICWVMLDNSFVYQLHILLVYSQRKGGRGGGGKNWRQLKNFRTGRSYYFGGGYTNLVFRFLFRIEHTLSYMPPGQMIQGYFTYSLKINWFHWNIRIILWMDWWIIAILKELQN